MLAIWDISIMDGWGRYCWKNLAMTVSAPPPPPPVAAGGAMLTAWVNRIPYRQSSCCLRPFLIDLWA